MRLLSVQYIAAFVHVYIYVLAIIDGPATWGLKFICTALYIRLGTVRLDEHTWYFCFNFVIRSTLSDEHVGNVGTRLFMYSINTENGGFYAR